MNVVCMLYQISKISCLKFFICDNTLYFRLAWTPNGVFSKQRLLRSYFNLAKLLHWCHNHIAIQQMKQKKREKEIQIVGKSNIRVVFFCSCWKDRNVWATLRWFFWTLFHVFGFFRSFFFFPSIAGSTQTWLQGSVQTYISPSLVPAHLLPTCPIIKTTRTCL